MNSSLELVSIVERICKITDTPMVNMLHLMEEVGELSTEMIIEHGNSYKTSQEGVFGETVDVIVCCLALLANQVSNPQELLSKMVEYLDLKVSKWESSR